MAVIVVVYYTYVCDASNAVITTVITTVVTSVVTTVVTAVVDIISNPDVGSVLGFVKRNGF